MSDAVIIVVVTSVAGIATSYLKTTMSKISTKIDGRMDELLELTRKAAHAQGNLEGRAEQTQERKDDVP